MPTRRFSVRQFPAVAPPLLLTLAGCGGGGGDGTCVADARTGTLSVKITGAPSGAGSVTVGTETVTMDRDLTLAAGPYQVNAARVAKSGATARVAYAPSVDESNPCVRAGQSLTVNVTYTVIPSSGKLWVGVGGSPTNATALGYLPASVAATGAPAAAVAANTAGSDGLTFDAAGNLWVTGATTADPPVARYAAATLDASGDKLPDVVLDSPSFAGGIPGAKVLAFDSAGNLWVSVVAADKVVKFTPDQLAASGSPPAAVEMVGIDDPSGLAFDAAGNLWVASGADAHVLRIDARHLGPGAGPDLTITAQKPPPVLGTLASPAGLAFDAQGSLWVNYSGTLAKLTAADLSGTGTKTLTPMTQIGTDVLTLPIGLAFDEEGGLWFAYGTGQFARLGPTQLGASGNVAPGVVISSADVGYANWIAIYPAPAFTPLAHRLP
jgi:sugar lactone lactonase YvrE